jgi:hypothetical protein
MIQLYITITQKLKEVTALRLIDIDGTNEGKLYPAARVKLGKLNYDQMQGGRTNANLPITVTVELNPIHRSGSNSPVLDSLMAGFNVVDAVKAKLVKEEMDYIGGIMLTGEDLIKSDGKYKAILDFTGYVEYTPE